MGKSLDDLAQESFAAVSRVVLTGQLFMKEKHEPRINPKRIQSAPNQRASRARRSLLRGQFRGR